MIIAEINETIPNLPKPSAIPYMNPSVISDIYEMINKIIIVILIVDFFIFLIIPPLFRLVYHQ